MSSCSRGAALAVLALMTLARPALALNVHAVYRAACDRVVGVIMRVEKRTLDLMDLQGQLLKIPRHEVVSLAYYPVSNLPLGIIAIDNEMPPLRVRAQVSGQVRDLVEGWPVDYSEEKIAFLQRDGRELVIDRNSIWSLGRGPAVQTAAPAAKPGEGGPMFMHPQASGFCEAAEPAPDSRRVFPQQFLNEEVVIKRELDRLQDGYSQVLEYERDQTFYPVPQVYRNATSLGLWVPIGNRHGSSAHRTSWAPLLVDELSMGPFRYQHLFMTGSAPNHFFPHDEPQTQIYYRFKAAYFHASVMFDPALVLVGSRYQWSRDDLPAGAVDDRVSDSFAVELGFDLGPASLQLFPIVGTNIGISSGPRFRASEGNLFLGGPRFTFRRFEIEAIGGAALDRPNLSHRMLRVNAAAWVHRRVRLGYSGIYNLLRLQSPGGQFDDPDDIRYYEGSTITNNVRAAVTLGRRFNVEAYFGLELKRSTDEGADGSRRTSSTAYPKAGLFSSFTF